MIKYILRCQNKHEFESWFLDSKEFEKLKKKNLLECVICNTQKVDKSIMSPSIVGKKDTRNKISDHVEFTKVKKDLKKLRRFIEKEFEFVGDKFSQEVREIYYDNKKNKNIYGTATFKEREELEEEGIKFESIPWLDNKKN
tara:strand:+ start:484 stop:906 length:423 start_codon:yes stop_codon:yes gene_type:complete